MRPHYNSLTVVLTADSKITPEKQSWITERVCQDYIKQYRSLVSNMTELFACLLIGFALLIAKKQDSILTQQKAKVLTCVALIHMNRHHIALLRRRLSSQQQTSGGHPVVGCWTRICLPYCFTMTSYHKLVGSHLKTGFSRSTENMYTLKQPDSVRLCIRHPTHKGSNVLLSEREENIQTSETLNISIRD